MQRGGMSFERGFNFSTGSSRKGTRRGFVRAQLQVAAAFSGWRLGVFGSRALGADVVLGQGEHRYRVVEGWGVLDASTPVSHCHGIVCTRGGHIVLLTTHTANNVLVYEKSGKLLHKWGSVFPGAHGLSLVEEAGREVLFLTDLNRHLVVKATLSGEILQEWAWPQESRKYASESDYKPSWTLHRANGEFFVLDGYGQDYIARYGADGKYAGVFGGKEGGISHWGPHGGMLDVRNNGQETLLIAMSDQQHLLRLSLQGDHLEQIPMPGGNPRQVRRVGKNYFVAHLADNWPKDRNSRGFLSVLDENLRVVSNIWGTPPVYGDDGKLEPMKNSETPFTHPHDVTVDSEGSLYVAQFHSGNTYPIKLERI